MPTQRIAALEGRITEVMKYVAEQENVPAEEIRDLLASGTVSIPANPGHTSLKPRGIGGPLTVKVNANLGTSLACNEPDVELQKLDAAIAAGADAVMDLSTGGDMDSLRQEIVKRSTIPVGTVPIYDAAVRTFESKGDPSLFDADDLFNAVRRHAEDGVDFVTVHCGVTRKAVETVRKSGRVTRIVSRGGSLLAAWMEREGRENPLYERYDDLLAILREHDVTISLGDGLRPGSGADATDVGPLVIDVGAGYDHITGAIGGALAGMAGADFLCYVTPAEHLSLPNTDDVRRGVMASRIAAMAVDVARGNKAAIERNLAMSKCRASLDWQGQIDHALDPEEVSRRLGDKKDLDEACSMCSMLCAMKVFS
jgi:phosphomethylpyrimidine synthase